MENRWLSLFPNATKNEVKFLIDGEEYFTEVVKAIKTAKNNQHYIYILGWMLDIEFRLVKDRSETFLDVLKSLDKRVEIRILIWDTVIRDYSDKIDAAINKLNGISNVVIFKDSYTYSPSNSKSFLNTIRKATGISFIDFLNQKVSRLFPQFYHQIFSQVMKSFQIYIERTSIGSHHEKVIIVQGEEGLIAFCGGLDINKNRVFANGENRFPALHDEACYVKGPAAYKLLEKFKIRWSNHLEASKIDLRAGIDIPPESVIRTTRAEVVGTFNGINVNIKLRTLKKAYLDILENAQEYIYIQDQYLVNLDVARILNKKIKNPKFKLLIIVIQDAEETSDILIPNRKRNDFMVTIFDGASSIERLKVFLTALDRRFWKQRKYHIGMHAKTLIVDDQIAIVGSANVNQRSFTNDSETSIVIFGDNLSTETSVSTFRLRIWKELFLNNAPPYYSETWEGFSLAIFHEVPGLIVRRYNPNFDFYDDADKRLERISLEKSPGQIVIDSIGALTNSPTSELRQLTIENLKKIIVYILWPTFIDPDADSS
jgi:phosphatidylserine/phosphatidylglycerophosphate/cardiolipin synthase-like enzyme